MLMGPRASQVEDTLRQYYGADSQAVARCVRLAHEVAKWMRLKRDGQQRDPAHHDVDLMVQIPVAVRNALQVWGREARDPGTGRRLGISGVARNLIVQAVLNKHPGIRATLQASLEAERRRDPDRAGRVKSVGPRRRPVLDE
jgi:hypothetical protein